MNQCFGTMLPEDARPSGIKSTTSKIFTIKMGVAGMAPAHKQLEYDLQEWEKCRACNEFTSCYKFSIAKAILQLLMADK